ARPGRLIRKLGPAEIGVPTPPPGARPGWAAIAANSLPLEDAVGLFRIDSHNALSEAQKGQAQIDIGLNPFDIREPFVLVYAGQSNAASSNENAAGGDLTVDPDVYVWTGAAFVVFDPANGVGVPVAGRNSLAFQWAKTQRKAEGRPVYVIIDAWPGEAIINWVGDGIASKNYVSLRAKVSAALAHSAITLWNGGGKTQIDAFGWSQGESDNVNTLGYYITAFATLKTQLRGETWFSTNTPIVCTTLVTPSGFDRRNDFFRNLVNGDDPYVIAASGDGLTQPPDNLHWLGSDMNAFGPRLYAAFEALPHPAARNTVVNDGQIIRGGLDGQGWQIDYNTAANQSVIYPFSDATGLVASSNIRYLWATNEWALQGAKVTIQGDLTVTESIKIDNVNVFNTIRGLQIKNYFGSHFADIEHEVNTVGKAEGVSYWDSINDRLVVAKGPLPSDLWAFFTASGSYTPA
ncbi:MAG: sialate O-acetylesterase, partial [Aurantimonas endophytica]|uniref:sialate O-acetylesterase n=1 Tax=Aurantimonas endophytica TaxID=1522175 RepID=UPI00300260AA